MSLKITAILNLDMHGQYLEDYFRKGQSQTGSEKGVDLNGKWAIRHPLPSLTGSQKGVKQTKCLQKRTRKFLLSNTNNVLVHVFGGT